MNPSLPQAALPNPSEIEQNHSENLSTHIQAQIEMSGGAISFAQFMEAALYTPGLGYYSAGKTKFGAEGDFITSPELGNVFARCVANAIAPTLLAINRAMILEVGGGSGIFAADCLLALETLKALPTQYAILERSADLRARQFEILQTRASHLLHLVVWLDAPPTINWQGVLFANEFIDALPVERFIWRDNGTSQQMVVNGTEHTFALTERPADARFTAEVERIKQSSENHWETDFCSEFVPNLAAWMFALSAKLERGLVLFVDYGYPRREYYRSERNCGTLVCHYRHRAHDDPLQLIGLQDITAFVDFTALAEAVCAAGFELAGFVSQAHFLLGSGVDSMMQDVQVEDSLGQIRLSTQIKKLVLPGEMGERFQVIGFYRGDIPIPTALEIYDRRERL